MESGVGFMGLRLEGCRLWALGASDWVAVKELKLTYNIGETLLFTFYTYYGNLV